MQSTPRILVYPSPAALANAAAAAILDIAHQAIAARGRFVVALTGGSTPEKTYQDLVTLGELRKADWSRWYVFMSDDRHVPVDDSRSNFGMAKRMLLNHVPIPVTQLFPVPTEIQPVERCAAAYDKTLRTFFGNSPAVFDLILLGLGDDGHTASLFPHAAALSRTNELVTSSPPGTLPPPVNRVTFTFPFINAAREIMFLVGGANKAQTLQMVFDPASRVRDYPAVGIRPVRGGLSFMLDAPAAALLNPALFSRI